MPWRVLLILLVAFMVLAEMDKLWRLPWPPTREEVVADWRVKREFIGGAILLLAGVGLLALDIVEAIRTGGLGGEEEIWADIAIVGAFLAIVLHKLRTAKVFVTSRGVWFADRQFYAWDRFHPLEIEAGVLRERAFLGLRVRVPASFLPQLRELYRQHMDAFRAQQAPLAGPRI